MSYVSRSLIYMPKNTPSLKDMLMDIGNPHPKEVAKALKVTERSVWRWLAEDKAPHSAMLAIYWLTRWGMSEIEAAAHNAAIGSAGLARCLQDELNQVKATLERISKIGDFGSSNDPAPGVVPIPSIPIPHHTGGKTTVETQSEPSSPGQLKTELNPVSMRVAAS